MKTNLRYFVLILLGACALEDDSQNLEPELGCEGKCDEFTEAIEAKKFECGSALVDRSGRGFIPKSLASDPFFQKVFAKKAGGCPTDFASIMAKLETTDNKKCSSQKLVTRVVSEQAAELKNTQDTSYRTVTSRECDGREVSGLLFSMFGWHGDLPNKNQNKNFPTAVSNTGFPSSVEIISFDAANGVFNYYKALGQPGKETMNYFGNSIDFITQGPQQPFLTAVRGCATCHTGGGLIMKEFDAPWLHWQENDVGREQLVTSRKKQLGDLDFGPDMESVVDNGNEFWNRTRLSFLRKQPGENGVKKLLEPLFCTNEVNIVSGNTSGKIFIQESAFIDDEFGFASLAIEEEAYNSLADAVGLNVEGTGAKDNNFRFSAIKPGSADQNYISKLKFGTNKNNGDQDEPPVVSDGFVTAIRLVDFTRPAFSDDKCALLAFAPELTPANRTPDKILDGFIANLKKAAPKAGTPAKQFLEALEVVKAGKDIDTDKVGETMQDACAKRQTSKTDVVTVKGKKVTALSADLFKLRSLQRKVVFGEVNVAGSKMLRKRELFEFPDTLAADNIAVTTSAKISDVLKVHPQARLNPKTCELTDKFVAVPIKAAAN